MMKRIVTLGWALPALALGCGATTAQAAGNRPGSSCGNGTISALNQYCEQIPSATGRQTPRVGTAALGSTPAASAIGARVGRVRGTVSVSARERLRSLPAAVRAHPIAGSVTGADIWSLSLTLILVLIALALALSALAYLRWRRHRPA